MNLCEDPIFYINGNSKRPHELIENPKFFGTQYSSQQDWKRNFERRREIKGNHAKFFVVAVASLTKNLESFLKVVPEQSFEKGRYTGKFNFTFYTPNGPKTVVIDDRLPISSDGSLKYSDHFRGIFWYPLLEKAYAEFCGGYDQIATGLPMESFFHLTGRKAEFLESGADTCLPYTPSGMHSQLERFINEKFLLVCKLNNPISNNEQYGSGFTIIEVSEKRRVSNDGHEEQRSFVKLRHPSGRIEKEMADEMGISEIDLFGEGLMDIEKFLKQMMCVYHVKMERMPMLSRNAGVDAFLPFVPISSQSPANRHRCRK